jgi:hypothetical protein
MGRYSKSVCAFLLYSAAGLFFPAAAAAGLENRPLNTSEAALLQPGHFALAAGAKYLGQSGGDKEYAMVTDWEYGFLNRFEFDLELPFTHLKQTGAADSTGFGDMSAWLGCELGKERSALPARALALSWATNTASQSRGLGGGENAYQGILLLSKTFGKTSVHFNGSYTFADNPIIGYNFALKRAINDTLTLAAEVYEQKDQKDSGNNTTDGLIGAIYALSPSASLDLGIGRGFTNASPNLRITGGVSFLW